MLVGAVASSACSARCRRPTAKRARRDERAPPESPNELVSGSRQSHSDNRTAIASATGRQVRSASRRAEGQDGISTTKLQPNRFSIMQTSMPLVRMSSLPKVDAVPVRIDCMALRTIFPSSLSVSSRSGMPAACSRLSMSRVVLWDVFGGMAAPDGGWQRGEGGGRGRPTADGLKRHGRERLGDGGLSEKVKV